MSKIRVGAPYMVLTLLTLRYKLNVIFLIFSSKARLEVIILFPCSTQLSTKFILLINVKMPTIVGILTFISMMNTTSKRLKARNFFICRYFSFYEQLKFPEKSFITSGPVLWVLNRIISLKLFFL